MSSRNSAKSKYNQLGIPSKRLDFFQVLSGVLLAIFVFGHLCLVSSVLLGPQVFDGLAWFLEEIYIAQIILPGIFLLIILHFVIAARKMPFRQGELTAFFKHSKAMKHKETWAWLAQVITGIVLIAFALIHVWEVLSDLPITTEKSAARIQAPGASLFYLVLMFAAWIHVGIGIFRMGVKYGYITAAIRKKATFYIAMLVLACLCIGLLTEWRFSALNIL